MKNHTNVLLGIATVIGLSASSSVFADSIHGVLENNQVSDKTVEIKSIAFKHDSTLWTIQDYVNNARNADTSVYTKAIAVKHDSTPWSIQDLVSRSAS